MYSLYINEWVVLLSAMFINCLPICSILTQKAYNLQDYKDKICIIEWPFKTKYNINLRVLSVSQQTYQAYNNHNCKQIHYFFFNPYSHIFIWLLNGTSWLNWKKLLTLTAVLWKCVFWKCIWLTNNGHAFFILCCL